MGKKKNDLLELPKSVPVFGDPAFKAWCRMFEQRGPGHTIGRDFFKLWVEIAEAGSRAMAEGSAVAQEAVDAIFTRIHATDDDRKQIRQITEAFGEVATAHPFADILGPAATVLDAHNKNFQQFFTPSDVGKAMATMMISDITPEEWFGRHRTNPWRALDLCCGTGVLLLQLAGQIHKKFGDLGLSRCEFWGCDIDRFMIQCTTFQARIHGIDQFGLLYRRYQAIARGERAPEVPQLEAEEPAAMPPTGVNQYQIRDTPPAPDEGKFDLIISNPPFGKLPQGMMHIPEPFPISTVARTLPTPSSTELPNMNRAERRRLRKTLIDAVRGRAA